MIDFPYKAVSRTAQTAADDLGSLHSDVWSLNTAMKWDEFLKLPAEGLVIGLNHRGEEVALTMNLPLNCYKIHKLYMPDGKEWEPCNTSIDMDPHDSLTVEVRLIKSQLGDYLKQKESQERNGGLRRKCVSNLLFWVMIVTGC